MTKFSYRLHYGREVHCMHCNGDNQRQKPLCAGCHSLKYPKHKK